MAQNVKKSTCNAGDVGDTGSILGLGRSPGGGHGNPLQYFWWENPMDRSAWWLWSLGSQRTKGPWSDWTHTLPSTLSSSLPWIFHFKGNNSMLRAALWRDLHGKELEPLARSHCGTEDGQDPHEWSGRFEDSSFKLWDDYKPGQQLYCNLIRALEPETPG